MKTLLRTISRLIAAAGLLGSAAAFLLAHLARTRMGVMRDLHVRNEPLMAVLDAPLAHWGLRLLVIAGALFLLLSLRRAPFSSILGMAAALFWLAVSFLPDLLGLATPWMLSALAVLIVGCLGMAAAGKKPGAKLRWDQPPSL